MIVEYDMVQAVWIGDLVLKVNSRIEEGWEPIGGICVTGMGMRFAQAMVKRDYTKSLSVHPSLLESFPAMMSMKIPDEVPDEILEPVCVDESDLLDN